MLEKFLIKHYSDAKRQGLLSVLQIYVERRKTLKPTNVKGPAFRLDNK